MWSKILTFAAEAGEDEKKIFDFGEIQESIPKVLMQALIGISVVLLVLAVIILLLTLFSYIFKYNLVEKTTDGVKNFFRRLFGRKKKAKELPPPPPAVEPETVSLCADEETVAAISAALALVLVDPAGKPIPFRIRKIRHL